MHNNIYLYIKNYNNVNSFVDSQRTKLQGMTIQWDYIGTEENK